MNNKQIKKFQDDIINKDVNLEQLLREGYVVAKEMQDKNTEKWISDELNGYAKTGKVPDYRKVTYELVAGKFNQVLIEKTPEMPDKCPVTLSIAKIIDAVKSKEKNDFVYYILPLQADKVLNRVYKENITNVKAKSPANDLVGIYSAVKNKLMFWAINLPVKEETIKSSTKSSNFKDTKSGDKNVDSSIKLNVTGDHQKVIIEKDNSKKTTLTNKRNFKGRENHLFSWLIKILKKLFGK